MSSGAPATTGSADGVSRPLIGIVGAAATLTSPVGDTPKERHRQRERDRMRAYRATPQGKTATEAARLKHRATEAWRANHAAYEANRKPQARARDAVRKALRSGLLVKADACISRSCLATAVEAHHLLGYGPGHELDVVWVCRQHHLQVHGRRVS